MNLFFLIFSESKTSRQFPILGRAQVQAMVRSEAWVLLLEGFGLGLSLRAVVSLETGLSLRAWVFSKDKRIRIEFGGRSYPGVGLG